MPGSTELRATQTIWNHFLNSIAFAVGWVGVVQGFVLFVHVALRLPMLAVMLFDMSLCRVKQSWGWLQTSGLPVHITCVNSYLTALIKEVSPLTLNDWNGGGLHVLAMCCR